MNQQNIQYIDQVLFTLNDPYYEKFKLLLENLTNDFDISDNDKFQLLKKFLSIATKLTVDRKVKLLKLLWSFQKFRNQFKYFIVPTMTTITEKKQGPFCSLFNDIWTDDFSTCFVRIF